MIIHRLHLAIKLRNMLLHGKYVTAQLKRTLTVVSNSEHKHNKIKPKEVEVAK